MSEKLFIVPESDLKNLLNLNRKDISDYQEIPWWANALADVRGTQLCDFVEIKTED